MKKSLIVLFTLFLLLTGTVVYGGNILYKEQNNVQFTEKVLYGDAAIVDGVTVERAMKYDKYLYWNSIYTAGKDSKTITTSTLYEWEKSDDYYNGYGCSMSAVDTLDLWEDAKEEDYIGITAAYKELYDSLELGESGRKVVYLKDYMDYYHLAVNIFLPEDISCDTQYYTSFWTSDEEKQTKEYQTAKALQERFNEFFKIPVLEEDARYIEIYKDVEGYVSQSGASDVSGKDSYKLWNMSVYTDTDCYLTFNTHTLKGKVIDTSLIPGGYGIYAFSYDSKKNTVDTSTLRLVYGLDPTDNVQNIQLDAKKENLLIFTVKEECNEVSIINLKTMEKTQSFTYGESVVEEERMTGCSIYEDFMVLSYGDKEQAVVSIDKNGVYTYEYEIVWDDEKYPVISDYSHWDMEYDWDGERLLFANSIWETEVYYEEYCGFYLGAFDKNGLLYLGEYACSLDTGNCNIDERYNYLCEPSNIENIKISW